MADQKKAFTFIIVPQNTSKTYTLRIRRGMVYFLGAICLFFIGSYAYVLGMHQRVVFRAQRAESLEAENAILRSHSEKISELKIELARLQHIRKRLYELAGMPEGLDADGGSVVLAPTSSPLPAKETSQLGSPVSSWAFKEPETRAKIQAEGSYVPTIWPVRGWVTAEFNEELPGKEKKHTGLDIAAALGTTILTAASGKVVFTGWDGDLGLVVIVDHQNGLSTLYGHCSKVTVKVGDVVFQGQGIAQLGNTGQSSAPHVHFEIRENDIAVDPRNYLGP